jgi:Protein of unknown function (DUF3016)
MSMRMIATVAAVAALVFGAEVAWAGTAEVNFVAPDGYSDPGSKGMRDLPTRETVLREIKTQLLDLAQRNLAPDQSLKIDILDIDIAGRRDVLRAGAQDVRIYDDLSPPRIKLRFALSANGKDVASGEETLSDPTYLSMSARVPQGDPLRYERPMLTKWFVARFVRGKPAG